MDWEHPENNDFAVAEEVTVRGKDQPRRPDVVLYVNGVALGVLEMKRSTVSVGEGVRQNIGNQSADAIGHFFTTVQIVMAGSITEGLRYGRVGSASTPRAKGSGHCASRCRSRKTGATI